MKITGARKDGPALVLETTDPAALRWLYEFKPGDWNIVPARKQRSLDANAYAWVLINKIADAVGLAPDEVYRREVKNLGGASEIVCIQEDAAAELERVWAKKGLGWQCERFPSKLPGCVNMVLHYGSSAYDTRQMSAFIDALIQEAKALGIETMTPDELARLLGGWT